MDIGSVATQQAKVSYSFESCDANCRFDKAIVSGLSENLLSVSDFTNASLSVWFPATDLGHTYGVYIFDSDGRISVVGDTDYLVGSVKNENTVRGLVPIIPPQFAVNGRALSDASDTSLTF